MIAHEDGAEFLTKTGFRKDTARNVVSYLSNGEYEGRVKVAVRQTTDHRVDARKYRAFIELRLFRK